MDPSSCQHWADIDPKTGALEIPAAIEGAYRFTVYADGIFGHYTKDDIKVVAGQIHTTYARWREESAGEKTWRIGTSDKSSGVFKHGNEPDLTHSLHPTQYRIYWAVCDFLANFPDGVVFQVGESDIDKDMNYVHWSAFGGMRTL